MQCGWHVYKKPDILKPIPPIKFNHRYKQGGANGGKRTSRITVDRDGVEKIRDGYYIFHGFEVVDWMTMPDVRQYIKHKWKVFPPHSVGEGKMDLRDIAGKFTTKREAIEFVKERVGDA